MAISNKSRTDTGNMSAVRGDITRKQPLGQANWRSKHISLSSCKKNTTKKCVYCLPVKRIFDDGLRVVGNSILNSMLKILSWISIWYG